MKDLNLENAAAPEDVSQMLRDAAETYRESVAELQSAWQDPKAGTEWEFIANRFDLLAADIETLTHDL